MNNEDSNRNTKRIQIDFKADKFKDFFSRVIADMNCLCGNYEK